MQNKKFIDIEKILQEKAFKLYKWLPRFAINWLKKKLHEDDINDAMEHLKDDVGLVFNSRGLEKLGAKVESLQNPNDFGNLVRGLNVYGYQVTQPDAVALLVAAG